MKYRTLILPLLAITLFAASCQQRKVTRINPNQQVDLSGRWNDVDNQKVANDMIKDVMEKTWYKEFETAKSRKAVVIIGQIKNNTSEFIDPVAMVKELERAFVNSGNVRVVSSAEERKIMREEREDQQIFSSEETRKKWGKEKGADFMLNGVIYSVTDQYGKEKVVAYQINFELDDLETNEKVWIGQSEIKKYIKN